MKPKPYIPDEFKYVIKTIKKKRRISSSKESMFNMQIHQRVPVAKH